MGMTVSAAPTHRYTGKERDTESGNDYFLARYYNSNTGRFLSPDWDAKSSDPVPYAKLFNPQSLNLYAYVYNNPLRNIDINGHCPSGSDSNCAQTVAEQAEAMIGEGESEKDEINSAVPHFGGCRSCSGNTGGGFGKILKWFGIGNKAKSAEEIAEAEPEYKVGKRSRL